MHSLIVGAKEIWGNMCFREILRIFKKGQNAHFLHLVKMRDLKLLSHN